MKRLKVLEMDKIAYINVKLICPKGHLITDKFDKKERLIIDLQTGSFRGYCSKCGLNFNIEFPIISAMRIK